MHPHKWWSILKKFVFGANSSLSPILNDDGSVTCIPFLILEVFSDKKVNLSPFFFSFLNSLILILNFLYKILSKTY